MIRRPVLAWTVFWLLVSYCVACWVGFVWFVAWLFNRL